LKKITKTKTKNKKQKNKKQKTKNTNDTDNEQTGQTARMDTKLQQSSKGFPIRAA